MEVWIIYTQMPSVLVFEDDSQLRTYSWSDEPLRPRYVDSHAGSGLDIVSDVLAQAPSVDFLRVHIR
jgi:hypothetical protein